MKDQRCDKEQICDRKRIRDFLEATDDRADPLLADHLEACDECRAYFDQQVAASADWTRVSQFLKPDQFDPATTYWHSAGSGTGNRGRRSAAIKDVLDALAPTDDPARIGRLGKYEIMGAIGAGGMGVVLKAFEPALDRVVAIKVLSPHLANNGKARQRFEREARAAAAVRNPNVIPIYNVSSDGTLPYLVMSYVQGGSLQQRLESKGAATTTEVLRIGAQIAAGLAAAHEQGLVHRDIKPENILFEGEVERIAITDFGLARAVDDNSVTQAGAIAGTPMYMSPEQARGDRVDTQSDLFSLGSVLYAMCTGQPPFRAESSLGVMRMISEQSPAPMQEWNADVPPWLAGIVEKMMARDKAKRFATAKSVQELLERCLSHVQSPETVPLPESLVYSRKRTQKSLLKSAVVLISCLLCISSIAFAYSMGWMTSAGETTPESSNGSLLAEKDSKDAAALPAAPPRNVRTRMETAPMSDVLWMIRQILGEALVVQGVGKVTGDASNPELKQDLVRRICQFMEMSPDLRDRLATGLIERGNSELAGALLAEGRVDPVAAEALKLGELQAESGKLSAAVDSYLSAFLLEPSLFDRKYIQIFETENRLDELAAVFTPQVLENTQDQFELLHLLDHLIHSDEAESVGVPFLRRLWLAREDLNWQILSIVETDQWKSVPDLIELFRPRIIPPEAVAGERGWAHLLYTPGGWMPYTVDGGWYYKLNQLHLIDDHMRQQLRVEAAELLAKSENWQAGRALVAILDADLGNNKTAIQWIDSYLSESESFELKPFQAEYIGLLLGGHGEALDSHLIRLYEFCLQERRPEHFSGPLRDSSLIRTAKLYAAHDRHADALRLIATLVNRDYVDSEFESSRLGPIVHDVERVYDICAAARTLTEMGFPLDSLELMSRIHFDMRRTAVENRGGILGDEIDELTMAARNSVSSAAAVEAISRGVMPLSLSLVGEHPESSQLQSPVLEVLQAVAHSNLQAGHRAAFQAADPELADAVLMDSHLENLLAEASANVDLFIAATLFAFMRQDIEVATRRIRLLESVLETRTSLSQSDLGLWLVAGYARHHRETAEAGHRLAERARLAADEMGNGWPQYFKAHPQPIGQLGQSVRQIHEPEQAK